MLVCFSIDRKYKSIVTSETSRRCRLHKGAKLLNIQREKFSLHLIACCALLTFPLYALDLNEPVETIPSPSPGIRTFTDNPLQYVAKNDQLKL